jgi:glycosyltransferase involved in cell wall biosynthesis
MMRILVATDAWHPQVNGVVRTLHSVADAAPALGATISFLTPEEFRTIALPAYGEIRLAIPDPRAVLARLREASIDAVHIATEGPIGHVARAVCRRHGIPFTTSFHTRFPDYIAARVPLPRCWTAAWTWNWLRRFHAPASAVLAATPSLARELAGRGFRNVGLWPRGVDTARFHPQHAVDLGLPRPVFLSVGRLAVEKNIDAFLGLDLPGTKVVVGNGPERAALMRRYPHAVFLGARHGEALAAVYAAADVFVFPSRTDTFGLVLLEALASGVPFAGFPVPGPQDVVGDAPVGALDIDLRVACLRALTISREACRAHACRMTWTDSARSFLRNIRSAKRPTLNRAMERGLRQDVLRGHV